VIVTCARMALRNRPKLKHAPVVEHGIDGIIVSNQAGHGDTNAQERLKICLK